jgi:hypothetical protein
MFNVQRSTFNPMNRTASLIYSFGILAALLLMGFIVWSVADRHRAAPLGGDRAKARERGRTELHANDNAALSSYAWQDETRGMVRLPIARAIELTLEESQNAGPARARLLERLDKATAPLPRAPEQPSEYE